MALHDATFAIQPTNFVSFVGPSGCGKSMAFYPYFVAQEFGYFKDEGIEVELAPSGELVHDTRHVITESLARELDQGLEGSGVDENPGFAIGA